MDFDQVALTMAKVQGEVHAFRDIFAQHTTQDMEQFQKLSASVEKMDDKLDQLLIREAERKGEVSGIKRSAVFFATSISLAVSMAGVAFAMYVG
jgi:hypothetical protein